jgi:hypothetical protein
LLTYSPKLSRESTAMILSALCLTFKPRSLVGIKILKLKNLEKRKDL